MTLYRTSCWRPFTYLLLGKLATADSKPQTVDSEKISEFLQDMQELGIGDPTPSLIPSSTRLQNGIKTSDGSDSRTPPSTSTITEDVDGRSGTEGGVAKEGPEMSDVEKRLASEWVPLGLSFGIPLFDERANKIVCEKVRK